MRNVRFVRSLFDAHEVEKATRKIREMKDFFKIALE